MSRTVPLKEAVSKDQTPLCSSPIKTPTTQDHYRDDLDCFIDTNDEICFFDTNMPQIALVPMTGLQQGSVRIVSQSSFLIFMYHFVACKNLKLTCYTPPSYFILRRR